MEFSEEGANDCRRGPLDPRSDFVRDTFISRDLGLLDVEEVYVGLRVRGDVVWLRRTEDCLVLEVLEL